MYQTIQSYTSGSKILEIGSGIGNISEYFITNNKNLCLSDIQEDYVNQLKNKFSTSGNTGDIFQLDIIDKNFDSKYKSYFNYFDSIFALNVIEHIANDDLAIKNCKKLLNPKGNLIILVPAYQSLYNNFDKELGHIKRYNKDCLNKLLEQNQFTITRYLYFNLTGILGWYLSGTILRKKLILKSQMKFYNTLVPVFKLIDKISFNKIGLSCIAVATRKEKK